MESKEAAEELVKIGLLEFLETATGPDRYAAYILLSEIAARQVDCLNATLAEPLERIEAETRLPHAKLQRLLRELNL